MREPGVPLHGRGAPSATAGGAVVAERIVARAVLFRGTFTALVSPRCHQRTARRHKLARPAGLEPATLGSVGRYSIQLSYGRAFFGRSSRILELGEAGFKPDPRQATVFSISFSSSRSSRSGITGRRGGASLDLTTRSFSSSSLLLPGRTQPSDAPGVSSGASAGTAAGDSPSFSAISFSSSGWGSSRIELIPKLSRNRRVVP